MITVNNIFECRPMRVFLLLFSLVSLSASAQTDTLIGRKVITNARMISLGAIEILDTYLSPEKYTGTELRYISHTIRRHEECKWSQMIVHQGSIAQAGNRSGIGSEIAGRYQFSYGWHLNWQPIADRLQLKAGGMIDADLGFIYNTRNGNNPAQALAALNLTPSVAACYRLMIKRRAIDVSLEAEIPLIGLRFSPNYGQSYYELFAKGNYDHNIVPTFIGNAPSMRHLLAVDFPLLGGTCRIGYLGDFRQTNINHLKSHIYTHAVVIGVVKKFKFIKIR